MAIPDSLLFFPFRQNPQIKPEKIIENSQKTLQKPLTNEISFDIILERLTEG